MGAGNSDGPGGRCHRPGSGLLPVIGPESRILVLGSFPGEESLRKRQYYAHPRNRFWYICEEVLGCPRDFAYDARVKCLKGRGIALWDVLDSCRRCQSSDSSISDPRPNPIPLCFRQYPAIHRVVLNGSAAAGLFMRSFEGQYPDTLEVVRMPSTSPANARVTTPDLVRLWQAALG
jgi:G:T/U mismatch-specific DNA glycosylase